ncbi:MAG: hypothetical protein NVS3B12_11180 [Acidimicrobiales bacterium]
MTAPDLMTAPDPTLPEDGVTLDGRAERWRRTVEAERADAATHVLHRRFELEHLAESTDIEGRDDEHDPDGSTAAFSHSMTAGLLATAERRLEEADAALGRLDAGTYGRCATCDAPLDEERLAALPTTRDCVGCARGNDRRGRLRNRSRG